MSDSSPTDVYVRLREGDSQETVSYGTSVNIDHGLSGEVIGVEVLGAISIGVGGEVQIPEVVKLKKQLQRIWELADERKSDPEASCRVLAYDILDTFNEK